MEQTENKSKGFGRFIVILAMVLIVVLLFRAPAINGLTSSGSKITGNAIADSGDVQTAKMKVVGGEYVIEPSEFKKGVLVQYFEQ